MKQARKARRGDAREERGSTETSLGRSHMGRLRFGRGRARAVVVGACSAILGLSMMSCSNASATRVHASSVLLVPELQAGWAGWCLAVKPGGGCAAGASRPPIVAETWQTSATSNATVGYALTSAQVAAVSVGGRSPIPTVGSSNLPDGLRAAAVEFPHLNPETELLPPFVPLDANGRTMAQSSGRTPIRDGVIAVEAPTRTVADGKQDVRAPCELLALRLPGLRAGERRIVTRAQSYSGLIGLGYIACERESFSLNGWPLVGVVLLSAGHPGSNPTALPAMKQLAPHSAIYRALGPEGEMVARRISGGWLVVSGAKQEQRLRLLSHLTAFAEPTHAKIAEATGLTRSRVGQIAKP
jgi:hypothetical protein